MQRLLEYLTLHPLLASLAVAMALAVLAWELRLRRTSYASVSPQQAIRLAGAHNVPILYDTTSQAPHFNYTDENNRRHTVWFEDARSIEEKFNLLTELGLRGISYWKLGLSFPQNWLLIADRFDVVKRPS